ncbi:MAG: HlyD family efflux transporter periplasmic adaptor subunit [Actinobacteria bacterium]|jgi:RND family efflux transporter MFP subunit|nr:HlyD family efflux transporter periplasmic adaptor subunit [Actinomycetota bacterium]
MRRRILWINLALVVALAAAGVGAYLWLFAPKSEASTGRTVAVQQGSISETVTATGTVETAGTVDLAFTVSGTLDTVSVEEGDRVRAGKVIATLDDSSAKQAIESARASYVQAVSGQTQSRTSLAQAQESVAAARATAKLNKTNYARSVTTAKADLADARTAWSESCLDPSGACPDPSAWAQLRAAESDVTSAKTAYDQAVQTASADETTNNLKVNQADVAMAKAAATQNNDCNTYGSTSQQCTSAVSSLLNAQQQYEMTVNTKNVAAVQSQQSLVNADARITTANVALRKLQTTLPEQAKDAIAAAEDALESAEVAQRKGLLADQQSVDKAEQSLASLQAAATAVDTGAGAMTTSEASIAVARAGLTSAQSSLKETILRSPVRGTIGSVQVSKDSAVQAGTAVVTLIPKASYQVVAGFSEADAMKVAVGQPATVTFDALADGTATGTVTAVDVLPTTGTTNVTTYGATITLDDVPDGLRDGMSASVVVTVDEAADVLWAPTAAITTAGGQSTVTIRKDGVDTTVQVETGLAGDSGTEITSGVVEGDQLVVSTSTTGGTSGFPMGGIPGGGTAIVGVPPAGGPPA